jgi:hypothetical protein
MEVALLAHQHMHGVNPESIDIHGKNALQKLLQQVSDNFTGNIKVDKEEFTNVFEIVESIDGFEVLDESSRKFVSALENKLHEFEKAGPRVQAFQAWLQMGKYEDDGESDVENEENEGEEEDSDDEDYDVEMGEEAEDSEDEEDEEDNDESE